MVNWLIEICIFLSNKKYQNFSLYISLVFRGFIFEFYIQMCFYFNVLLCIFFRNACPCDNLKIFYFSTFYLRILWRKVLGNNVEFSLNINLSEIPFQFWEWQVKLKFLTRFRIKITKCLFILTFQCFIW